MDCTRSTFSVFSFRDQHCFKGTQQRGDQTTDVRSPRRPSWPLRQRHFRWTILAPHSLYSFFVIHIVSKVLSEDRTEPPTQTEFFRSSVSTIFTGISVGESRCISLPSRFPMPANMVLPPDITMFSYRLRLISISHAATLP